MQGSDIVRLMRPTSWPLVALQQPLMEAWRRQLPEQIQWS